jgi:hypothetical protein
MLHITNGQATVAKLREGKLPGTYLAWDDPLHDGPVPATPSLEALSHVRARALADFGWGSFRAIRSQFAKRDRTISSFAQHEEAVLWFEHDLYDQLQLIQLLDWFSRQLRGATRLTLVHVGEHPERPVFHGLGELTGAQLAAMLPCRVPVADEQFEIGRLAWAAFCAPDPAAAIDLFEGLSSNALAAAALPFLAPALQRLFEEYPSAANGLSRSEQQLLVSVALGARHRHAIYLQSQEFEACPWGDASVFLRLDGLAGAPHPPIDRVGEDAYAINGHGRRVLAGELDWMQSSGGVERWIGGARVSGAACWRWTGTTLRRPAAPVDQVS